MYTYTGTNMGLYVCMYACMHVCMYACMYACLYIVVCLSMYVCMYVCMHVCVCICVYVCICGYVYMCGCLHACTYVVFMHRHRLYLGWHVDPFLSTATCRIICIREQHLNYHSLHPWTHQFVWRDSACSEASHLSVLHFSMVFGVRA